MRRLATLAVALALTGTSGAAQEAARAFDLVFRSGTLDGLPEGTELRYEDPGTAREAAGEGIDGPSAEPGWRSLVVGLAPGGAAVVEGAEGSDPVRVLGTFDAGIGNPVAMVFLEGAVSAVVAATGGSPVYVRNRMRDALAGAGGIEVVTADWEGATVAATAVTLRPFVDDAHRVELGPFADLAIRVVVSEAVPGWVLSLSAEAPATATAPAYASSLWLVEVAP